MLGSVLDLFWFRLLNVTHLGARFAGFVGSEETIGARNLDVWGHVGVGARQSWSFDASRGDLRFQSLPLRPLLRLLLAALLIAKHSVPFGYWILRWWHFLVQIVESLFKNLLLLFLLLLQLECFRLEHGEFWDSGEHFSGKFCRASLILINLLSHFKGGLSAVKSLGSQLLSQMAYLFVDELLFQQGFLLVV